MWQCKRAWIRVPKAFSIRWVPAIIIIVNVHVTYYAQVLTASYISLV